MPEPSSAELGRTIAAITPIDAAVERAAQMELDGKTKPRGSLGRLEQLAVQLAGIRGRLDIHPLHSAVVVAAADHGYAEAGVSAFPRQVTAQMLRNFVAGGAAVAVLAQQCAVPLHVVDVGVVEQVDDSRIRSVRVRAGTRNAAGGPAMTLGEALSAIEAGISLAGELAADGVGVLALGEMGIGNTTAASALTAALLRVEARTVCGRGSGLDDCGLERKIGVVEQALRVNQTDGRSPLAALAALGGLEIAFLCGVILGGAAEHVVVVLDGFIVGAAALVATRLAPASSTYLIAAHLSPEPGHQLILESLGLRPLLDWQLRLGEGSGATLVLPLLQQAAAVLCEMATFAAAAVSDSGR